MLYISFQRVNLFYYFYDPDKFGRSVLYHLKRVEIFVLFGRFLGNNSLVGPLPGLGSLINLQQLYVTATDSYQNTGVILQPNLFQKKTILKGFCQYLRPTINTCPFPIHLVHFVASVSKFICCDTLTLTTSI